MSNAAKLKKKAVELEQKKQFDKALALYIQFLQESDGAIDDVDVPLYNRVGDLMLRTGNASDALNYYEKAVDLYAERGFLNNAIALCNKVLRQSPGRASIYYKLGKISASKGFKSDAKKNFLEYADRMQKAGQIDEAFRALKEFADLCPDQDDIRLMLAEQLTKENRGEEALEQLQKLHDKLDSEGRTAEARATVDRMKSIDPEAVPRVSGSYRPQKSQDLIFLDTSFEQKARQRQSEPVPAPPPSRQVRDPDLVVLSFDQPDTPATPVASVAPPTPVASITPVAAASPVDNAAIADTFELDIAPPNEVAAAAVELPLLEVPVDDAFTLASDVPAPVEMRFDAPVPSLDLNVEPDPAPVDLVLDQPHYVTGPPLSVDYAGDLAVDVSLPIDDDGGLFDFRAPPRSDDAEPSTAGLGSLDPDVAFPSFDLDDTALPSADEVTSGASLAAALGDDLTLGSSEFSLPDPPDLEMVSASLDEPFLSNEPAAVDVQVTEPAAATPADALDLEWASASATETPAASVAAVDLDALELDTEPATLPIESLEVDAVEHIDVAAESAHAAAASSGDAYELIDDTETAVDIAVTSSADMAIDGHDTAAPNAEPQTEPAADDVDAPAVDVVAEAGRAAAMLTPVAAPVQSADAIIPADQPEQPAPAGWEVQRAHAERLLEAGDRAGGVRELETVAAELERLGDLERALSIVDELIRLSPDSVRHHQKRVELAFRSSDRVKLIDAYLELGDALFRSGEERKARAVYQRVLELAPDDPRAQAAVESVSSMSPPMGSGAIPAITASTATPEARPAQQRPRDTHVPYQPGPNHVNRPAAAVSAPPATRKPSPLDRSAAANGEFVDLGEWLRSGENPKSTRMVAEEKPPTGDEQADFQEMLKRFKQGIAENVEEEDYESHYDLGVAYKEMGLIDEAVAEFQKALRGTSNRVRTYEALGQCFVEKDQYHVAASVLTRAIALGDGDDHHLVGVLYLLARATEALSNPAAALDYYQRVFAVDIEFRDVAERISAIERKAT